VSISKRDFVPFYRDYSFPLLAITTCPQTKRDEVALRCKRGFSFGTLTIVRLSDERIANILNASLASLLVTLRDT
jgi:hypothetical protein